MLTISRRTAIAVSLIAHGLALAALVSTRSEVRPVIGMDALEISIASLPQIIEKIEPEPILTPPELPPEPPVEQPKPQPRPKAPPTITSTSRAATASAALDPEPLVEDETPPPVSAAEVAAPASSAPVAIGDDYLATLMQWLARNKTYPYGARQKREQGTVYLRFVMDRDGTVRSAQIEKSSGYASLDRATLEMLQRAAPLPAFPASMERASLELVLPVEFSLRSARR